MKENFFHTEVIESYLTGKLSGSEKAIFEAAMNQDPLLKNEVALQKDVVQALSEFRKNELKARLNNIDVSAGTAGTGYAKLAAAVALLAFLGTGILYLGNINSTEEAIDIEQPQIGHTHIVAVEKPVVKASEISQQPPIETPVADVTKETPVTAQIQPEIKKTEPETVTQIPLPKITHLSNDAGDINGNVKVPDGGITSGTSVSSVKPDVSYDKGNRKEFHYKYYNNKLYLFGDFNENVIEFLELNINREKNLYLLYKGDYYLLNQNQIEKAPLQKITDQAVITQLENL